MGAIQINDISDEMLEQLELRAAESGVSVQQFARDALEATVMPRHTRSGVQFNTMYGKLSAFKNHDWEAQNTEEIEAWENSTLP